MTHSNQYVINVLAASLIAEGVTASMVKRAISHAVDRITDEQVAQARHRILHRANRVKADFEANVDFEARSRAEIAPVIVADRNAEIDPQALPRKYKNRTV